MDIQKRYVLKHESGLYLSVDPDSQPNTKRLARARRFLDVEQISVFLEASPYSPDRPEEYEIQEIEIEYREVTPNVHQIGIDQQAGRSVSGF